MLQDVVLGSRVVPLSSDCELLFSDGAPRFFD